LFQPLPVENQILVIYAGTNGYVDDLPLEAIKPFERELYKFVDSKYPDVLRDLREKREITEDLRNRIDSILKEFKATFKAR